MTVLHRGVVTKPFGVSDFSFAEGNGATVLLHAENGRRPRSNAGAIFPEPYSRPHSLPQLDVEVVFVLVDPQPTKGPRAQWWALASDVDALTAGNKLSYTVREAGGLLLTAHRTPTDNGVQWTIRGMLVAESVKTPEGNVLTLLGTDTRAETAFGPSVSAQLEGSGLWPPPTTPTAELTQEVAQPQPVSMEVSAPPEAPAETAMPLETATRSEVLLAEASTAPKTPRPRRVAKVGVETPDRRIRGATTPKAVKTKLPIGAVAPLVAEPKIKTVEPSVVAPESVLPSRIPAAPAPPPAPPKEKRVLSGGELYADAGRILVVIYPTVDGKETGPFAHEPADFESVERAERAIKSAPPGTRIVAYNERGMEVTLKLKKKK